MNLIFEIALEKARIEVFGLDSVISGDYETDESTGVSRFESITVTTNIIVPEGTNEKKSGDSLMLHTPIVLLEIVLWVLVLN